MKTPPPGTVQCSTVLCRVLWYVDVCRLSLSKNKRLSRRYRLTTAVTSVLDRPYESFFCHPENRAPGWRFHFSATLFFRPIQDGLTLQVADSTLTINNSANATYTGFENDTSTALFHCIRSMLRVRRARSKRTMAAEPSVEIRSRRAKTLK